MDMRKTAVVLISLALLAAACQGKKPKVFDPVYVNFEASYNPYLENQFYPSLVMGVASLSDQTFGLNDTNALFSVSVTAPASNAVLRIMIDSSNLNYVTIFQEVLPIKDVRYTFHPSVKWKYDQLYKIRQQGIVHFPCRYLVCQSADVGAGVGEAACQDLLKVRNERICFLRGLGRALKEEIQDSDHRPGQQVRRSVRADLVNNELNECPQVQHVV